MALGTLGTNANTSLTSMTAGTNRAPADIAGIANAIKDDVINGHPIWPGAWADTKLLYIPNRGVLKVRTGDIVAVDPISGWPILVSAYAISVGSSVWHSV